MRDPQAEVRSGHGMIPAHGLEGGTGMVSVIKCHVCVVAIVESVQK